MKAADDERDEATRRAAVRDLVAGAALLAVGLATGGSSLGASPDGPDVVFDVLGAAWILWGLARLVRARPS